MVSEEICNHWLYDLTIEHPDGGITASYFKQADSKEEIPSKATHIRQTFIGGCSMGLY